MVRRLRFFTVIVLVLYACALDVLFVNQRNLLYPASDQRSTAAEAGLIGI